MSMQCLSLADFGRVTGEKLQRIIYCIPIVLRDTWIKLVVPKCRIAGVNKIPGGDIKVCRALLTSLVLVFLGPYSSRGPPVPIMHPSPENPLETHLRVACDSLSDQWIAKPDDFNRTMRPIE